MKQGGDLADLRKVLLRGELEVFRGLLGSWAFGREPTAGEGRCFLERPSLSEEARVPDLVGGRRGGNGRCHGQSGILGTDQATG